MCEPTTIALIATTVLSTGATVIAQGQAQDAQNKQAKYASAQADANAVVADANAQKAFESARETRAEGVEAQRAQVRQSKNYLDKQRQALASNGVFVGDLSAMDMLNETEALATQDKHNIRRNYNKKAFGIEQQGLDSQQQAQNLRAQAGASLATIQGAGMAQTATILNGATSAFGSYASYKADGGTGIKAWNTERKAKKSGSWIQSMDNGLYQ
jgi:hypothetical protein